MIDPSMYNRAPMVPDLGGAVNAFNQQRSIRDLAQLRKMELAQAQDQEAARKEGQAKQRTLKGLLEVNTEVGPDGRVSVNPRYAQDLAKMGMTQEAMGFQQEQAAASKASQEAESARVLKLLDARKNLLARVRPGNIQDYTAVAGQLKALGDDLDGMPTPAEFMADPGSLQRHYQEVLSVKEQKDLEYKQAQLELDKERLAETTRNNKSQAQIEREKIKATTPKSVSPEAGLPQDAKTQINVLATKTAGKKAILNQLKSDRAQLFGALGLDPTGKPIPGAKRNEELAYRYGQSMLKTMNSKEGADAVGVDEARRSGDALEYNVFDVKAGLGMKPGKLMGRDLDGFAAQVGSLVDGIEASVNSNQTEIDRIYGRQNAGPSDNDPLGLGL